MNKTCPFCARIVPTDTLVCACRAASPSSLAALGSGIREDFRDFFGIRVDGFDQGEELRYGLRKKSVLVAYLLWFIFGYLGGHRYYVRGVISGLLMTGNVVLLTLCALLGLGSPFFLLIAGLGYGAHTLWVFFDALRIPKWVYRANSAILTAMAKEVHPRGTAPHDKVSDSRSKLPAFD